MTTFAKSMVNPWTNQRFVGTVFRHSCAPHHSHLQEMKPGSWEPKKQALVFDWSTPLQLTDTAWSDFRSDAEPVFVRADWLK